MTSTATTGGEQLVDQFRAFYHNYYADEIATLAQRYPRDQRSLYITARDLYRFDHALFDDWMDEPKRCRARAEQALSTYDLPVNIDLDMAHVRLHDPDGFLDPIQIGDLTSDQVGEYVAIRGQLDKVTGTEFRLVEAAFECQRCGVPTHVPQKFNQFREPHECDGCERQGPFEIDFNRSEWVDQCKLKLKQPPEERQSNEGQSLLVFAQDDLPEYGGPNGLADHAGEDVTIYGHLKVEQTAQNRPEFGPWMVAHAVGLTENGHAEIDVDDYEDEFRAFASGSRGNPIDLCKQSLAPQLMVDDHLDPVVEAAVAWLFNAYRVDPEGRGQFRGDLHMCIIGDPGLGKSTLLSELADIAPECEYRSGTGVSAVGLTAAAKQEEFAGSTEWTLEPGILPRANGGHCIIDEIDDVVDSDTKKIHDALEGDQMVKVDKAGISADLPTRTAVLACGNPVDGRFDPMQTLPSQIDLDPALVSRMDILFGLQDEVDEDQDRQKADHILDAYDELSRTEVSQRRNLPEPDATETVDRPVPKDVLKAWIVHARDEVFPVLSPTAKARLREFYTEARNLNEQHDSDDVGDDPPPTTPRTLEAGIRLAIAFARVRLSDTVEERDADRAIDLTKRVIGLNYDPESGLFDANRTDNDLSQSQQKRHETVRQVIVDIATEFEEGAPINNVLDACEDKGIERSKAEHIIEKLRRQGDAYEPQTGHLRVV